MSWPLASRTLYRATRLMRPAVGGPDPDGVCHWREAQDMERHSCPKKAKRWMNSEHPPEDSPSFRARPAGNGRRGPMCTVHTPNFRTGHCERSEPFRIDGLQSCFLDWRAAYTTRNRHICETNDDLGTSAMGSFVPPIIQGGSTTGAKVHGLWLRASCTKSSGAL